jgi:hypothetical protein
MLLKADIINDAYSKLRVSGLTVGATPEDITLALNRLENMIREFQGRNICVDWEIVDVPDVNDYHNLRPEHYDAISTLLAGRLMVDFGKPLTNEMMMSAKGASSFLYSSTAVKQQTNYPRRQPRGAGNRRLGSNLSNFLPSAQEPPPDCTETFQMYVGDIEDYTEHYEAYLRDGEDIASFTIESDTGLALISSSSTITDVTYLLRADGDNGENKSAAWLRVKIVVTTTDGRKETRIKNFTLLDVEIP